METTGTIDTLLKEERRYAPPAEFTREAVTSDSAIYRQAMEDPEGFWAEAASTGYLGFSSGRSPKGKQGF